MYYIYVDEAGTSAKEPVTVVVGVLINADRHWQEAFQMLEWVHDEYVPKEIREDFIFHAKDVWGGYRDKRSIWPKALRADYIAAIASIPRILPTAICISRMRRDASSNSPVPGLTVADYNHLWCFWSCVSRANKYVRDWGGPAEVATVIAEDVPEKRRLFRNIISKSIPDSELSKDYIKLTQREQMTGIITQTNPGKIDRIVDTVHFVRKDQGPLIQIADACAFSFRRYFSEQEFGSMWVEAMLGGGLVWQDWQGASSNFTFSFDPRHAYPNAN